MEALPAELARLIAVPTVSDRPLIALAAHLASRAEDQGFRVERFDDPDQSGKCTVIAVAGPETTDGGLTITGHMDVVPTENQPWTTDPFTLTRRGDRLYGRGTADMKGFIASTLAAIDRIDTRRLTRPLALVWTHDEEVGCLGSAKLVASWREAGRTLPRACLVGEPTDFRILRMHPGHVAVEIVVSGCAAHSSRPDLGVNAIEGAARVVAEVAALARDLAGEHAHLPEMDRPWVAVNTAQITGGSAINIVPDQATVRIGYRPLPGMGLTEVWERLLARIEALDPAVAFEGRILRQTPSMLTPTGTPLQAVLARHAHTPGCGAAGFATDGGNLALLGLEPLVFGPGSIDVAHKADEHVPIAALHEAVDVVEAVIHDRCS